MNQFARFLIAFSGSLFPTYPCPLLAEEGGAGKDILIEHGAYKGMDACVM
jgi:hypothetical protein